MPFLITLLSPLRIHTARLWAAALLLCATATHATPTGLLNDTGQTQCDNGSPFQAPMPMAACDTGDAAYYKRQDGRFGRDRAGPAKVGGGVAGFDFTKLCFNGAVEGTTTGASTCTGTLVANTTATATGTPATDWACTRDNVTNLIWSLQTQGTVTWNAATVVTYPDAGHNTPGRCGFSSGWRLPTKRELLSIVLNDGSNPSVDAGYFPSTQGNYYWASEFYAPATSFAWIVDFVDGRNRVPLKTTAYYVRLVRSGQ